MSMQKWIAGGVVLAAAAAIALWHWSSPDGNAPAGNGRWLGYVEGEVLHLSAPVSGTLVSREVERGQMVAAGAPLFTVDPEIADAEAARLRANVEAARASLADLRKARLRAPELDVSRAAQLAAGAEVARARKDFERIAALARKGYATRARLDSARASYTAAQAALRQAQAEQRSGELTGRIDQIHAAEAAITAAEAALRSQLQRRADYAPRAPAAALVEQTFFNAGEWVPANAPVVALLPHDKRKLRFFVPQADVSRLRPGDKVHYACGGCDRSADAIVRYIAPRAEFTPPVIYSQSARAKLVFMVEAALPADQRLPVGLPVDVWTAP